MERRGSIIHNNSFGTSNANGVLQNCDLPPPVKLFPGSDKTVVSPMKSVFSMMRLDDHDGKGDYFCDDVELDLLKALRLSQTRAREAERKATGLAKERDRAYDVLLQESLRLSAYRRWVMLLEVQVKRLKLHSHQTLMYEKDVCHCLRSQGAKGDDEDDDKVPRTVALAICLSFAGVGFALGCRHFWS